MTRNNLLDHISIWKTLQKRNEIKPFLYWLITGSEKLATYDKLCENI